MADGNDPLREGISEGSNKELVEKNRGSANPEKSDYNLYFEEDLLCRICYDDSSQEILVVPCNCKGTMAFVHKSCLERWLAESNSSVCELCHFRYITERATRYTASEAICKWLRNTDEDYDFPGRNIRTDIVVCCMLTPFAFVGSGLCILTADYYSNERFSKIPAARWTSISLLLMIGIVVLGYYLWVYMVIKYHGQMWYAWWQRDSIVKVLEPQHVST